VPSRLSSAVQPNQCGLYANCGSGYLNAAAFEPHDGERQQFVSTLAEPAVSLNKTSREEFQLEKEKEEERRKRKRKREEIVPLVTLLHRVVKYTSHQLILIKMRLTLAARSLVFFRFEP